METIVESSGPRKDFIADWVLQTAGYHGYGEDDEYDAQAEKPCTIGLFRVGIKYIVRKMVPGRFAASILAASIAWERGATVKMFRCEWPVHRWPLTSENTSTSASRFVWLYNLFRHGLLSLFEW